MKAKIWIKVVGIVGVLLVASLVAGVAVLKSIDFNDFKADVETLASEATGREVTIAGDLDLVISLSPSLNMSDVTVGNAAWGKDTPMMVLNNLQAKVDLLSLLTGQVDVDYFVVDGLTLLMQTDGKGLANWEFESQGGDVSTTQTSGGLAIVPRVRDVRLKNIKLTYFDGATKSRFQVALANVDVQADTFDSPMSVKIKAIYNTVTFDVQGVLGSLHQLVGTQGGTFPVNLNLGAKGLNIKIEGDVEQPSAGMTVQARLALSVTDLAMLSKVVGTDLPPLKSIKASLSVNGQGTNYAFPTIDVQAGGSDFKGKLDVDLSQERPRLTGVLKSKVLDIEGLSSPQTQGATKTPNLFTTDPLPFDALKMADVDLSYTAQKVALLPLSPSNVSGRLKIDQGRLNLSPLNFTVGGGNVGGNLKINGASKMPKLLAKLIIKDLDVGQVLQALGQGDIATLKLNGKVDVSSGGKSTRALMQSLNGAVNVSGRDGRIFESAFQGLGAHVISCFVGKLPIKNGEVVAQAVLLDTPAFDAQVTGNIDLPGERLHLTVIPRSKTTSLASFAVPVRIKGTLSEPYVGVDATEAIAGTVGNIVKAPVGVLIDLFGVNANTGAKDPCVQAMSGAKTTPKATSKTTPKKQKAPSPQIKAPPASPVKDLGNALGGLFGR